MRCEGPAPLGQRGVFAFGGVEWTRDGNPAVAGVANAKVPPVPPTGAGLSRIAPGCYGQSIPHVVQYASAGLCRNGLQPSTALPEPNSPSQ